MKTKEQVIDFIKSESYYGNSISYATIGQGGVGLEISSYDFSSDLEDMDFDGLVRNCDICDDIKGWAEYDENMYSVYQFSDDSGLKYQIVTY